ncbi:GNAT family N-acetyltransferase [Thalassotalea sediminis]|uniref:GNAT family N-acetyltransferase n=1 Tax=Thalassotalea sediminis TaxID=1759089 RepID=UPI0025724A9B|nr:GNAT family N-acetyltransferase [Thalassotalea sediminis]
MTVTIRNAQESDRQFIFALSPYLAEVARLDWHSVDVVQRMQDQYIHDMLASTNTANKTLIAEKESISLGFIHVREGCDDISGEKCATVPLLAVSPSAQGLGVGKLLMAEAEKWARSMNFELLHLEVFANNVKAQKFYSNLGFMPEMLQMVKTL